MKKIIISILGLSLIGLAYANDKTGDLKSSATIQATCLISANQIGFGAIATPLLAQSAQSEMNVKCSNISAYTIELAYGGMYGQSISLPGHTLGYAISGVDTSQYNVYNSSGTNIGYFHCHINGTTMFSNNIVANLYSSTIISNWINNKACTSNGTLSGTYPTGWTGAYNATGKKTIDSTYNYGVMNGLSRGDKLAYSIAVPGDPNKVWNTGNNSYKSTGDGNNQTIPLIAKIVPEKSGSKYPAPDMYLDTVTAVISY